MYSKENKAELPGIFFFFGEVEPVGPENASFPVTELSPQLLFKCQLRFSHTIIFLNIVHISFLKKSRWKQFCLFFVIRGIFCTIRRWKLVVFITWWKATVNLEILVCSMVGWLVSWFLYFCETVKCSPDWPQTHNLASCSWVLWLNFLSLILGFDPEGL